MSTTTIKVPVELRDRINRDAKSRGLTAAGLIEHLLDDYQRRHRMAEFGVSVRRAGPEYWDEFRTWDLGLGTDGE